MPHHRRRNQQVVAENPLHLITTKIRRCCLYQGNILKSARLDLAGRSFCFKCCSQMFVNCLQPLPCNGTKYLHVVIPFFKKETDNLRSIYCSKWKLNYCLCSIKWIVALVMIKTFLKYYVPSLTIKEIHVILLLSCSSIEQLINCEYVPSWFTPDITESNSDILRSYNCLVLRLCLDTICSFDCIFFRKNNRYLNIGIMFHFCLSFIVQG